MVTLGNTCASLAEQRAIRLWLSGFKAAALSRIQNRIDSNSGLGTNNYFPVLIPCSVITLRNASDVSQSDLTCIEVLTQIKS